MRPPALALALLLAAAPAVAQSELVTLDTARWGTAAEPQEATGGDRGATLSLVFHNVGATDYDSARARLLAGDGLAVSVPGGDVASLASRFAAGASWEAAFRVDVADDARPGDVLPVRVELTVWRSASSDTETLSGEVRVPGRSEIGIGAVDPLLPGSTAVEAAVRVVNDGDGDVGRVSVVLRPAAGSGLLLAGDDAFTTPPLPGGESATIAVPLRTPAARGAHALVAELDYVDAAGALVRSERTITFQVAAPVAGPLRVALASPDVPAGAEADLAFTVSNVGDAPLRDIDLRATSGEGLTTTAGGAVAGPMTLAPGENATARVKVLAALDAEDLVEVTLEAAYAVEGALVEETFVLAVPVAERVELRLLSAEVLDGDLLGIVVNSGTGTAYNPRATVGEATAVLSEDIEPNEPVNFRVVGAGAEGGPVTVAFDWNDERGRLHRAEVAGTARDVGDGGRGLPAPSALAAMALLAATAFLGRGRRA